jgi:cell division protein FtsB
VFLPLLGSIVAVAFLFAGVFPTRALLTQRRDIAAAEDTLAHLESRNADLQDRVDALGTGAEIERIAREQYHLVYPGEEAYALLPAPPPRIPVPDAWPFRALRAVTSTGEVPLP